jgi:hypothetical protein
MVVPGQSGGQRELFFRIISRKLLASLEGLRIYGRVVVGYLQAGTMPFYSGHDGVPLRQLKDMR